MIVSLIIIICISFFAILLQGVIDFFLWFGHYTAGIGIGTEQCHSYRCHRNVCIDKQAGVFCINRIPLLVVIMLSFSFAKCAHIDSSPSSLSPAQPPLNAITRSPPYLRIHQEQGDNDECRVFGRADGHSYKGTDKSYKWVQNYSR